MNHEGHEVTRRADSQTASFLFFVPFVVESGTTINSSLLTFHSRRRNQREHFASGAICKLNREAGENPARPRHCDRGELASTPLTKVGKAVSSTKRESGDLQEAGRDRLRGKENSVYQIDTRCI